MIFTSNSNVSCQLARIRLHLSRLQIPAEINPPPCTSVSDQSKKPPRNSNVSTAIPSPIAENLISSSSRINFLRSCGCCCKMWPSWCENLQNAPSIYRPSSSCRIGWILSNSKKFKPLTSSTKQTRLSKPK